jgi:hypothetical protein
MVSTFLEALIFLGRQSWPWLSVLAVTSAMLMFEAMPRRRWRAGAPGLAGIGAFLLTCALGSASASTSIGALKHFPLVGLFLTVALFIPSIRSLKWRAMGWLHVLTLLCALFLYLICGLYLSGDSM